MNRSEKAEAIVELNQIFKDASLMVVTRQSGLTVQEVTDLRRKVRAAGASYKVAKNRLTLRALEGTPFKALGSLFKGPTAIAYSKDPVAAAKVISAASREAAKRCPIFTRPASIIRECTRWKRRAAASA